MNSITTNQSTNSILAFLSNFEFLKRTSNRELKEGKHIIEKSALVSTVPKIKSVITEGKIFHLSFLRKNLIVPFNRWSCYNKCCYFTLE